MDDTCALVMASNWARTYRELLDAMKELSRSFSQRCRVRLPPIHITQCWHANSAGAADTKWAIGLLPCEYSQDNFTSFTWHSVVWSHHSDGGSKWSTTILVPVIMPGPDFYVGKNRVTSQYGRHAVLAESGLWLSSFADQRCILEGGNDRGLRLWYCTTAAYKGLRVKIIFRKLKIKIDHLKPRILVLFILVLLISFRFLFFILISHFNTFFLF